MREGGLRLVIAACVLLLAVPGFSLATGTGGQATATYTAQGVGVIRTVDDLTGDFHGVFAAGSPITIVPGTDFNIVGAIANDFKSQRPPLAICVGPTALCSPVQNSGIMGLSTVSTRSKQAWPAGTPVNFYALNVALDMNHVPAYGSTGRLMVSWN
ncbi:MAG: hypothetical protein WDA16_03530 [Candidatus Thermoplasmatota archaeon]